nr:AAA family ATPase [Butyrivibrio sp. YAB3001]
MKSIQSIKESIFSGLNNLSVNTILDEKYDNFFGFTYPEVKQLLSYYGVLDILSKRRIIFST